MLKSFTLRGGKFGYVDRYYDAKTGAWIDVEPWNRIEDRGEPPIIVVANGPSKGGKGLSYTSDCRTHGFYSWCNMLSDYAAGVSAPEEVVEFEDLEHVAKAIGWPSAFGRRVYEFWPTNVGRNLRPMLVTGADLYPITEFSTSGNADAFKPRLEKAGATDIYIMGQHNIMFDFEVPS